jgi:hypothetical protein
MKNHKIDSSVFLCLIVAAIALLFVTAHVYKLKRDHAKAAQQPAYIKLKMHTPSEINEAVGAKHGQ